MVGGFFGLWYYFGYFFEGCFVGFENLCFFVIKFFGVVSLVFFEVYNYV